MGGSSREVPLPGAEGVPPIQGHFRSQGASFSILYPTAFVGRGARMCLLGTQELFEACSWYCSHVWTLSYTRPVSSKALESAISDSTGIGGLPEVCLA